MKKLVQVLMCLMLTVTLNVEVLAAGKKAVASTTDDSLFDLVRRKLTNDPDVRGGAFEVDVKNGVVTIKGVVEKESVRRKAERLAMKVKGVKKVENQLRISPTRN